MLKCYLKTGYYIVAEQALPSKSNHFDFNISDVMHVMDRGVTTLFGVDVVLEGPMLLPTRQSFSEPSYDGPSEEYLSEEIFNRKSHKFKDKNMEVEDNPYSDHGVYSADEIADLNLYRAIEASLLESKLREKEKNVHGSNGPDTYLHSQKIEKYASGSSRSPDSRLHDEEPEVSKAIGARRQRSISNERELNDRYSEKTTFNSTSTDLELPRPHEMCSPWNTPEELQTRDRESNAATVLNDEAASNGVEDLMPAREGNRHRHAPEARTNSCVAHYS